MLRLTFLKNYQDTDVILKIPRTNILKIQTVMYGGLKFQNIENILY